MRYYISDSVPSLISISVKVHWYDICNDEQWWFLCVWYINVMCYIKAKEIIINYGLYILIICV